MVIFRRKKASRILQNPKIFEQTPTLKPQTVKKLQVAAVAGVAALVALVWLLLFSPYFTVKTIAIEGDVSQETKDTIEKLKGRNIFLIGGKKAERELQEKQPWIKSIKIVRGVPDTVRVRLLERDAAFGWRTGEKTYLIDNEGVVFKEVGETKLPVIVDNRNLPVRRGDRVVTLDFIDFVESLRKAVPLQTDLKVDHLSVDETTFHVNVKTDRGFVIRFDTLRPLQDQLDDFNHFYGQKKDEVKEYADLRVEGYVYYK